MIERKFEQEAKQFCEAIKTINDYIRRNNNVISI